MPSSCHLHVGAQLSATAGHRRWAPHHCPQDWLLAQLVQLVQLVQLMQLGWLAPGVVLIHIKYDETKKWGWNWYDANSKNHMGISQDYLWIISYYITDKADFKSWLIWYVTQLASTYQRYTKKVLAVLLWPGRHSINNIPIGKPHLKMGHVHTAKTGFVWWTWWWNLNFWGTKFKNPFFEDIIQ